MKSSKLGDKYRKNLFVGDINNGNLCNFEVTNNTTGLKLNSIRLKDKVGDTRNERSELIFASGFKGTTDIKTGPDGYSDILSYSDDKMYRIVSRRIISEDHILRKTNQSDLSWFDL